MKKLVLVLTLVLALFTLTACDGSGGETETAQGVTEETVTVGNAVATSGALAFVGTPFKAGMDAYFTMVNDAGGVAGRTIEYIQYDDQFDSALGLTYTQQLVEDDEVFALVGHFGTPTVSATQEYLTEVGIPTVYYATGVSSLFNPDAEGGELGSFPVQPIYDAEGEVMLARAVGDLGASNVGVIYSNDDAGRGMLYGIQLRASELGMALASTIQVDPSSDDMSTAAQTMLASGVDTIIIAANQVPAATAVRALDAAGSTVPVITSYVNADATWLGGIQDVLANFDVYASAWISIFAEDGVTFSESYDTYVENIDEEYAANAYAFAGWIAAATFVVGLERVGEDTLTWDSYIAAMESEPVELPFGVVVDYADGRRVGTQAMAFLQGEVADEVAAWATEQPIQTIDEILAD
jgi:ABC-type branched-subunit amino acid transport system substrate-binding protein